MMKRNLGSALAGKTAWSRKRDMALKSLTHDIMVLKRRVETEQGCPLFVSDRKHYGQRWQVETVNSMIKRNLGSALRARTATGRSTELLLRVVTHNIMIVCQAKG